MLPLVGLGLAMAGAKVAPGLVKGVGKMFGGKAKPNPGDATRGSLHQALVQRATENPYTGAGTQAAVGQLDTLIGRQAADDEAAAVRMGGAGGELAIAQKNARGNAYTNALLGIFQNAEANQRATMGQALASQQMVDANYWEKRRREDERRAQLFQLIGSVAQGVGAAAAGGGAA